MFCRLGKILRPHGVVGGLKITSFMERTQLLKEYELFISNDNCASYHQHRATSVFKVVQNTAVITLNDVNSRDQADIYRDYNIYVLRDALPQSHEDEYYWHDLIGCSVQDAGEAKGTVVDVVNYGGGDLLQLDSEKYILFDWIVSVNLNSKVIVVNYSY